MNCQQAGNLFDAYLDGELSASLETELAAHRLQCAACRQELALLEVAGHVIAVDSDSETPLDEAFTERLLACIEPAAANAARIWYRRWWISGVTLAAAALAIACTVWLTRPAGRVAGARFENPQLLVDRPAESEQADFQQAADSLVQQVDSTWSSRADSAQSLLDFGQMTILQILDEFSIDQTEEPEEQFQPLPASFDELAPPPATESDIEDL